MNGLLYIYHELVLHFLSDLCFPCYFKHLLIVDSGLWTEVGDVGKAQGGVTISKLDREL